MFFSSKTAITKAITLLSSNDILINRTLLPLPSKIATDCEDSETRRLSVRPQHLSHAEKSDIVVLGGALLSDHGENNKMIGSVILYEAESEEQVRKEVEQDPYVINNVWESYQIVPFKVISDSSSSSLMESDDFLNEFLILGMTAVVGQASRHFDPLIINSLELCKSILEIYDNIQYNKRICDCLIDRVESIEMAIKSLKRHKEENNDYFFNQNTYNDFHKLIYILERIQSFMTDISQLHGLRKFIDIQMIENQFWEIVNDFDELVWNLRLRMTYSKDDQKIRDSNAIKDDIIIMTKFLNTVKSGITTNDGDIITSNIPQIRNIFEEIILKKNHVTEFSKSTKYKTNTIPFDLIKEIKDNNEQSHDLSRGHNIQKKFYDKGCVACKYFDDEQTGRFHNELSMLNSLNQSDNIIRFHGLSKLEEGQVLVFDWAERGDLQTLYENFDIDWSVRLKIAVGIGRGLLFLHGCQILHRELRCQNVVITKDLEPKIANFNFGRPAKYSRYFVENITAVVHWLAPEKLRLGNKIKFSHKCDIFSFGMLLWEICLERIPYKDWSYTNIIDHVKAGKRESMDLENPTQIQRQFQKIIRAAWQDDPTLRPGLHELFIQLEELYLKSLIENKNTANNDNNISDHESLKRKVKKEKIDKSDIESSISPTSPSSTIDKNNVKDKDLELNFLPIVQPILLLEEGIKSHKSGEKRIAWECFQAHADLGNNYAKYWQAHYLTEGYHIPKDVKKGTKYFKEAADADVADSQLRYAFSLYHDQIIQDTDAFLHYLTLAAENGNATAQFNLGRMYYAGMVGLSKDREKGLQYLKMAALKNQPRAIQFLSNAKVDRF
ncbi:705_t:CDS:2 [Diversispora eburnea]|uniref:705_t:CDS:1 n=1 Tax=Diversispora eburnea TaxID=1213867 RepID=A0A9N8VJH8_9GLOM|nr:705_t:CDS:2 [Diversispora eburnea]